MRLLMCIPYFTPAYAFGGSVTVAERIVAGLLDAGHEVTVATTDVLDGHRRVPPDAPARPAGAEVLRFRNVSHRLAAGANGYTPRGLRNWLRGNAGRFDVVLLQDVYSALSVMGARAAVRAGVPYVLQPHGTISPASERGRPVVKRAFLALWGRRTVASASALFCLTDHERSELLEVGAAEDRLLRVPQPIETPPAIDTPEAVHPTVAFVGRLHPIKGLDRLIEAVALARREVPELRLEIGGPANLYQRRLEALASSRGVADAVRFHGFVDVEAKARLVGSAHCSALLSAGEALPVAALESMMCGTPVVLSEGCHLPEADGRAGVVVGDSARDAADAIAALMLDPERRRALSEGALAFAAEFRRDVVLPRMVAALEVVAAGGTVSEARAAADRTALAVSAPENGDRRGDDLVR